MTLSKEQIEAIASRASEYCEDDKASILAPQLVALCTMAMRCLENDKMLALAETIIGEMTEDAEALRAENERLRTALQWIIEFCDGDEVELNTIQSRASDALKQK